MKAKRPPSKVQQIPLDQINVANPRVRNRKTFEGIVRNIEQLGLKRPITVTKRATSDGTGYDLVCGQGRLEAYRELGQREIPALIIDATEEDSLVMSLVENIARRQHRAIDLLHDIEGMKRRGHSEEHISRKTDLTVEYVRAVIRLLENSEHRLLRAVESGAIPVSVAVQIADSEDTDVQSALQRAYENGSLKGKKLAIAQKLVEQRRRRGKDLGSRARKTGGPLSPNALIRTYKQDVERKRQMVRIPKAQQPTTTLTMSQVTIVQWGQLRCASPRRQRCLLLPFAAWSRVQTAPAVEKVRLDCGSQQSVCQDRRTAYDRPRACPDCISCKGVPGRPEGPVARSFGNGATRHQPRLP
jgi:ParB family chromosome partitioning protein